MKPVNPVLPKSQRTAEIVFAKDQPEYLPLPAIRSKDHYGMVTTRWRLTWTERVKLLLRGNLYLQVLTFHKPVQPQKLRVDEPTLAECLNVVEEGASLPA